MKKILTAAAALGAVAVFCSCSKQADKAVTPAAPDAPAAFFRRSGGARYAWGTAWRPSGMARR